MVPDLAREGAAPGPGGSGLARVWVDGDANPIVRVEPRYPTRALEQRREGRVLVEFTIAPSGAVEQARVVRAEPQGFFEVSALQAVSQWRYASKVVNGRAVAVRGVRTILVFRLDRARS